MGVCVMSKKSMLVHEYPYWSHRYGGLNLQGRCTLGAVLVLMIIDFYVFSQAAPCKRCFPRGLDI